MAPFLLSQYKVCGFLLSFLPLHSETGSHYAASVGFERTLCVDQAGPKLSETHTCFCIQSMEKLALAVCEMQSLGSLGPVSCFAFALHSHSKLVQGRSATLPGNFL